MQKLLLVPVLLLEDGLGPFVGYGGLLDGKIKNLFLRRAEGLCFIEVVDSQVHLRLIETLQRAVPHVAWHLVVALPELLYFFRNAQVHI